MADKTKKLTVKSNEVLGEQSRIKDIVVDIPDIRLEGQARIPSLSAEITTPEIKASAKDYGATTKTQTINLEVTLEGLGEERQPDSLQFIYRPDIYTVVDYPALTFLKPTEESQSISDNFSFITNPFKVETPLAFDENIKVVETVKSEFFYLEELVAQTLEKPFVDKANSSDYRQLNISPSKADSYFVNDDSYYVFTKFLFDKINATDDHLGNLNPDDDQEANINSPELDTTGITDEDKKLLDKAFIDISYFLDIQSFIFEKINLDSALIDDAQQVLTSKTLEEFYSLSDFTFSSIGKVTSDLIANTDTNSKTIESAKLEVLTTTEEVEATVYKAIFDFIKSTDDAFGNLNPDDDQTASTQRPAFDASGVSDVDYRVITKAIFDAISAIDRIDIKDDSIKDTSTIEDLLAAAFSKYREDTFSNSDEAFLHPRPNKLDSATVNDILTAVVNYLYNINDVTTITTSGRINKQDYFLEEYTVDDYTGENFYF